MITIVCRRLFLAVLAFLVVGCDMGTSLLAPIDPSGVQDPGAVLVADAPILTHENGALYYGRRVVVLVDGSVTSDSVATLARRLRDKPLDSLQPIGVYYIKTDRDAVEAVEDWRRQPGVRAASLDYLPQHEVAPATSATIRSSFAAEEKVQWGFEAIHADSAWRYSKGDGVRVGVVDGNWYLPHKMPSGYSTQLYDLTHPDLDSAVDEVVSAHNAESLGALYSLLCRSPSDVACLSNVAGHGPHVAGIIAANADNNQGMFGIAPRARLRIYIGAGLYGFLKGAFHMVSQGNDVINLSMGYYDYLDDDPVEWKLVYAAWKGVAAYASLKNTLIVTSAGNSGRNAAMDPMKLALSEAANALVVGNSDQQNYRAEQYRANYGSIIHLYAPGTEIFSATACTPDRRCWGLKSGTSMAAPHVTGVAALIYAAARKANEDPTAEAVAKAIVEGAEEGGIAIRGHRGGTRYLLNAPEALRAYFKDACSRSSSYNARSNYCSSIRGF